jgi:hypothetical protein
MIPEAQDAKTLGLQPLRAKCIFRHALCMLAAIKLDNDFLFKSDKIHNVFTDGCLPPKFDAPYLPVTQLIPKPVLGVRHVLSQMTRE